MNRYQLIQQVLRKVALAAALIAVGSAAAVVPARAADSGAAGLFGSVDVQKITASYSKKADYDKQITALQDRLNDDLTQLSNSPMLSTQDQDQLGTLLAKPNPTADDTAQINALEQKSAQATQQLAALQQKPNLTSDENQTMNNLLAMQKAALANKDVQDAYQQQIQQLADSLSAQMSSAVKAAITTVAKQHGLAVVFDSQVAIYTANDITDDVVKVLNK